MTGFRYPLRYAGGSQSEANFFADYRVGLDPDMIILWDDFVMVDDDQTNDWTVIKDSGASVGIAADTEGGQLALTSAATTENDGASIQGNEIFDVGSGTIIWFETHLKVFDADQCDMAAGLTVNFATNPEAMETAADRIVFKIADGDASILCITEKNGTATSTDSGVDAVDATLITLGFRVKDASSVEFYINRNLVATHTTNIPDDELLAAGAYHISGSASGTHYMNIDYILAAQQRD